MTTFQIDTGDSFDLGRAFGVDVANVIATAAADNAGEFATPEQVAIEAAKLIVARIWEGKKPETVRRNLLRLWPLIAPMAETAPDSFDKILTEFAERATEFR